MTPPASWLSAEIERWTDQQIITPEQAARLRALYPAAPVGRSWALAVFFSLGAVVVGLGVILLFAYNWDALPKAAKLTLVFSAVLGAHSAGLWLRVQPGWRATLGEGLLLFGTMAFGSGIWLIAQIYHINEHFPNGFLFWGLGALALAWALPSLPQALLATVVLTVWGGAEFFAFDRPVVAAVALLLGGVGPLAWRYRSGLLTATLVSAVHFQLLSYGAFWGEGGGVLLTLLSLSVLLLGLHHLTAAVRDGGRVAATLNFFGTLGFVIALFVLSFPTAVEGALQVRTETWHSPWAWPVLRWSFLGLALIAWASAARLPRDRPSSLRLEHALFPTTLVLVHLLSTTRLDEFALPVAVLFNLTLLGLGAAWIIGGCREGHARRVIVGSILLAVVLFARYFDLFDSLASRGFAFLLFGALLFAQGFYYRRCRERTADGREAA
jgi:uncharacterized membrane protein